MKRLAVPLAAALLFTVAAPGMVASASVTTRLTAWLATNGAATLSLPSAGTGTIAVRLTGLTPRKTYTVTVERGTCAPVGNTAWLSEPA